VSPFLKEERKEELLLDRIETRLCLQRNKLRQFHPCSFIDSFACIQQLCRLSPFHKMMSAGKIDQFLPLCMSTPTLQTGNWANLDVEMEYIEVGGNWLSCPQAKHTLSLSSEICHHPFFGSSFLGQLVDFWDE